MDAVFEPCCLATTIGSLPHTDAVRAVALILAYTPEIPAWPQLPRRPGEGMLAQFSRGLPGLVEEGGRAYFRTASPTFEEELVNFYSFYLAATEEKDPSAREAFALSEAQSAGLYELLAQLPRQPQPPAALKGQITGPFTLATNLTDEARRCAYYDERLRDAIVKSLALQARWQAARLKTLAPRAIIFIDEPALLGFGSATFVTVGREDVQRDINEVAAALHGEGALAGVHCEANTDWSLLLEADLDILSFDAYAHWEAMTLYPAELAAFLKRGGSLAWGLVPTADPSATATETAESLAQRFEEGLDRLAAKGLDRRLLARRALVTPSCGAGTLSEALAERMLQVLRELSLRLRGRYGFHEL